MLSTLLEKKNYSKIFFDYENVASMNLCFFIKRIVLGVNKFDI